MFLQRDLHHLTEGKHQNLTEIKDQTTLGSEEDNDNKNHAKLSRLMTTKGLLRSKIRLHNRPIRKEYGTIHRFI